MLNEKGEYGCAYADDEFWTVDGVTDRMRAPLAVYENHVMIEHAEETLLHAARPVRSLYLVSDAATAAKAIPRFLPQLTDLCSLRLPSQIAPTLRPEMIGPHVRELAFYGTYDERYWNNKTVTLPSGVVFSGIESLTGQALCYRVETRFRFAPAQFPNLRSLGFTFDTKRQFARTLRELPHLISVSAASFDTLEGLADLLPCQGLVSLTLYWNKNLQTLQGIERFPNLRYLKLGALTQLRTLDGIDALRQLEFVGVYWSKRVEKVDALLNLPALKSVDTFGVDAASSAWLALKQMAGARGIGVRLIG